MTYLLSIVFHRFDRYPSSEEYGEKIDVRLDQLTGGVARVPAHGDAEVPIKGFDGMIEYHETGPVFRLNPADLPALAPLLTEIRAMTRDWAERSSGPEPKKVTVSFSYGPDDRRPVHDEQVTREAADAAESFDELIRGVLSAGAS